MRLSRHIPIVFSAHGLLMDDERPRLRDRLASRCLAGMTAVSRPAAEEYMKLMGWRYEVKIIDNGVPEAGRLEADRRRIRRQLSIADEYTTVGSIRSF